MKIIDIANMHKAWTIVVLALLILFLLPSCGGGPTGELLLEQEVLAAEGANIASSDGKIALEIPPGALPKDTKVTLRVVLEDDWADDVRALEPVGPVYSLEPDGLEFSKPAKLTMRLEHDDLASLELPEGAYPACIVFTKSEDGMWDILRNPTTTVDIDTGEVLVRGEATHFSEAVVRDTNFAAAINPSSVQKLLDETWSATVTVFNLGDAEMDVWTVYYQSTSPPISVESDPFYVPGFKLAPGESRTTDPPPLFSCGRADTGKYGASISASPPLTFTRLPTYIRRFFTGTVSKETEEEAVRIDVWGSAECKWPVATPTPVSESPTPPTTPESTATPPAPTETDQEPIIITEEGLLVWDILMVIPPKNFNDEELFIPKEFFEGKGAEVTVASTSTYTAEGMFGKTIKPDLTISDVNIDLYDAFVIVGGNGSKEYLWENDILITLVRSAYERDKVVSAICLSSVVLARAGILEGMQATVFQDPEAIGELKTCDAIYVDEEVVVSGRVITGRGPESSTEFALKIWDALIIENPTG